MPDDTSSSTMPAQPGSEQFAPGNSSLAAANAAYQQEVTQEALLDFEIEELEGRLALGVNVPYGATVCSCCKCNSCS